MKTGMLLLCDEVSGPDHLEFFAIRTHAELRDFLQDSFSLRTVGQ
jgi:hypothetical protein